MPLTFEELSSEAIHLPVPAREELVARLVESLGPVELDDVGRLWAAEAIDRRDAVRSGKVAPNPGDEVLAEIRRMVGR